MIQSESRLAAQVGLQVGHEKGGGDSFAGNVADDEAELVLAEVEDIEVIASHVAGGKAKAGVFEGLRFGMDLREEAGLDLLGDFQFLGGAAFQFQLLGDGPALLFQRAANIVESDE